MELAVQSSQRAGADGRDAQHQLAGRRRAAGPRTSSSWSRTSARTATAVRGLPGAAGDATRCASSTARTRSARQIARGAPNDARVARASRAARTSTRCSGSWTLLGVPLHGRTRGWCAGWTTTPAPRSSSSPRPGAGHGEHGGRRRALRQAGEGAGRPGRAGGGLRAGAGPPDAAAAGERPTSPGGPDLFVASVDEKARDARVRAGQPLRAAGCWVEIDTRGGSLKSQMKRADKTGAQFALVLGERELRGAGRAQAHAGRRPRAAFHLCRASGYPSRAAVSRQSPL